VGGTIVVSGLGLCTPLGADPLAAMAGGDTAVRSRSSLEGLPDDRAAVVDAIDLQPWLKRRKDKKLMARAAQLALASAGPALGDWPGDRLALGLFMGVGREPGDDGESEAALLAAQVGGRVDAAAVAGRCRDVYPPLLPLRTLPNMALAHVSIHLGIGGENGAWAGHAGAGMTAMHAGWWAVFEGRCPAALIGAADSRTDAGTVRDRHRVRPGTSVPPPPGEAGIMLLIEPAEQVAKRGGAALATIALGADDVAVGCGDHHDRLGDCGAADAVLAVALAILRRDAQHTVAANDPGQPTQSISVAVDASCAWYAPPSEEVHR
jgi:hypothetical protein